jgi:sulfur-carrier protein
VIKVLFFAHVKEKAGKHEAVIEQSRMTAQQVRAYLNDTYGINDSDRVMIAVNEVYAEDSQVIKSGDVVAVIPPVSGG